MTDNPNAKYGFGPNNVNGSKSTIIRAIVGGYEVLGGGSTYYVDHAGRLVTLAGNTVLHLIPLSELASSDGGLSVFQPSEEVSTTQGAVGQEAPNLVDRLRAGTLEWAVIQQAADEIERLQGELVEYKNRVNFRNGVLKHMSEESRNNAATIAHQQALLVALVECKDALLAEHDHLSDVLRFICTGVTRLYQGKGFPDPIRLDRIITMQNHGYTPLAGHYLTERLTQRTSHPAKATPEMVEALRDTINAGFVEELAANHMLAAAPTDDRDARIAELEAEVARWAADYFGVHTACKRLATAAEDRNEVDALRDKAHREDIAKLEEDRDELKRQLEKYKGLTPYANGYADALEHGAQMPFTQEMIDAGLGLARAEIERLRAKCPPDDVLEWLRWCLSGAIVKPEVTNRASRKYAEWILKGLKK